MRKHPVFHPLGLAALFGLFSLLALALTVLPAAAACPSGWQGPYKWDESAPPDMFWEYSIRISEQSGQCRARVQADGHMTAGDMLADVQGNAQEISLRFLKDMPDATFQSQYRRGDVLLRLKRQNKGIITQWGKMQPAIQKNARPGVRFKRSRG